jgi:predicted house-cleaning noncanonical NTP pyrophosphatase (MazG superfamily)
VGDGKLVRDKIPDLIRQSGRHIEVRYLSGEELIAALAAKLSEQAQEAAEAVGNRRALVEELADLTEVMSALTALRGIDRQEILDTAQQKASQRGSFQTGAWIGASSINRCHHTALPHGLDE